MKHLSKLLAVGALAATILSPASAAVIWQDQFNRPSSNSVGNGWTEIENDASDVAILGNTLLLRDTRNGAPTVTSPDAAATQSGISAAGYQDLFVEFGWGPLGASDPSDKLYVSWKPSSTATWTTLGWFGLGGNGSYVTNGFLLGSLADDTSIDLRFWTNVDDHQEGARIDWVTLSGNEIPPPPPSLPLPNQAIQAAAGVPAPGTLALLGVGLAALGSLRRR